MTREKALACVAGTLLALPLAACGGEAKSDLTTTAVPVARVFELGESMYIRCVISNPKGRHVQVYSTEVYLSTDGGKNTRLSRVITPSRSIEQIHPCTRKFIEVWPIDVGLGVEKGKAKAAFNKAADVVCRIRTKVAISTGPGKAKWFSLWATCRFKVKAKLFNYDPPLDAKLRSSPRLHRFQTNGIPQMKSGFLAVETFAWANRDKPIGKNLLWQVARRYSHEDWPTYYVRPKPLKGKVSFAKVLESAEPYWKVPKGAGKGPDGPDSARVVKYLSHLLETDDGHFAHYEEAGVTLVRRYVSLGKEKEALKWSTRVRDRLRATSPGYSEEVDSLHERISTGFWKMGDEAWGLFRRPPMAEEKRRKLLSLQIQVGGKGKDAVPAMSAGDVITYVQGRCGQLPIKYEHRRIYETKIKADVVNTEGKMTVREYLERVLSSAKLGYRVEGNMMIVHRLPEPKKPEK